MFLWVFLVFVFRLLTPDNFHISGILHVVKKFNEVFLVLDHIMAK